jgi:hypothetical protein
MFVLLLRGASAPSIPHVRDPRLGRIQPPLNLPRLGRLLGLGSASSKSLPVRENLGLGSLVWFVNCHLEKLLDLRATGEKNEVYPFDWLFLRFSLEKRANKCDLRVKTCNCWRILCTFLPELANCCQFLTCLVVKFTRKIILII